MGEMESTRFIPFQTMGETESDCKIPFPVMPEMESKIFIAFPVMPEMESGLQKPFRAMGDKLSQESRVFVECLRLWSALLWRMFFALKGVCFG